MVATNRGGEAARRRWERELEEEEERHREGELELGNDEWVDWNWITLDVNQVESSNEFLCPIPVQPNMCTMQSLNEFHDLCLNSGIQTTPKCCGTYVR